ncbi:carcinine hydrolase/isopenicillin-N N-acyltransferase family protein [Spirosoma utsteinense]|uniref:Tetratricopeptide (TPR) repeat protein n=1 Tax=Spirosoma utsteinense TaxID=2585773 RepID=A0ABR6WG26_9BACT|nr:acyl-CoA--6-aminopenicillanic acid acyl-transferase [Spirosoma utsteinense]MBC3789233.1 tetratricopeptide (TPR) repeat protein [Spirosoma utsteinense]MBC3795163.1 tetratricopeptide (TPR) repeat protein [Spirosoma utsteinense]
MIRLFGSLLLALWVGSYSGLRACTIFTASNGQTVLVGNNEDSSPTLKTYLWYHPARGGRHGFVSWGSEEKFPEGGMNEKGLFWDAAALMQAIPTVRDAKKPDFKGYFVAKALSECATVAQVIQLVQHYNLVWQERAQVLVADASGDYALIHANYIIRKSDRQKPYVAVTNFCLKHYHPGQSACYRYNAADSLLKQHPVSVSLFRMILAKAAQQAPDNATIYSQIADLKAGTFILYQRHHFDQGVTINLAAELKKGVHQVEIKRLFPQSVGEALEPVIAHGGIRRALAQYAQWHRESPGRYNFGEDELDGLGYRLLNTDHIADAIQIFALNQRSYPASDRILSSLASAYLVSGNKRTADSLYRQALQLSPANYVGNLFANQPQGLVSFRVNTLEYANKIKLVGSFNGWSTTANPFVRTPTGEWLCQLKLRPGVYHYTFLVGDDNWMTDPLNKLARKPDKYWQSVLIVQ